MSKIIGGEPGRESEEEHFQTQLQLAVNHVLRQPVGEKMDPAQIKEVLLTESKDKISKLAAFEKLFLRLGAENFELTFSFIKATVEELRSKIFDQVDKKIQSRLEEQMDILSESVPDSDNVTDEQGDEVFKACELLFTEEIEREIILEFDSLRKLSLYDKLEADSQEAFNIIFTMLQKQLINDCQYHVRIKLDEISNEEEDD